MNLMIGNRATDGTTTGGGAAGCCRSSNAVAPRRSQKGTAASPVRNSVCNSCAKRDVAKRDGETTPNDARNGRDGTNRGHARPQTDVARARKRPPRELRDPCAA